MSSRARYVKVGLSSSERGKTLVGYRVIADIAVDANGGRARELLLERPDVAPAPEPKPRRKRRTKKEMAAAAAPVAVQS